MIGDGYCHDYTNNRHCSFDGGDCCGACTNTEHCSECKCKTGFTKEIQNAKVGDGFCQDLFNNEDCNFDGGDCCGSCVNTKYCTDCECNGDHFGVAQSNPFFANGFCQDEINTPECNFDGFDCCSTFSFDSEYCEECVCKGNQRWCFFNVYLEYQNIAILAERKVLLIFFFNCKHVP